MQRYAGLALILAAACGGKLDGITDDGAIDDALGGDGPGDGDGGIDAMPDADIDAPPPSPFSGRFTLLESEVVLAGAIAPVGQGIQARIVFTDNDMLPDPVLEENAGPTGCKVWEYTPQEATLATVGQDEGSFSFVFNGGSNPPNPPQMPRCSFAAGIGYRCSDFATNSSAGSIDVGAAQNTATLTDADVDYTSANSLDRYIQITGAAIAGNNGLFPILAVSGNHQVTYLNASRAAELLPGGAVHVNFGGVGPIPGVSDPGFMADDVQLTATHVAGGASHVPAFILQTNAPGHVGDDFALDQASQALLAHVPRSGEELRFTCATNCEAGNADTTVVDLITTDAPVAGLPPTQFPPPFAKQVEVRCIAVGSSSIIVPAAYSAKLMGSGATRIEATYARGALLTWPSPPVTGLVGHAIVSYTTST